MVDTEGMVQSALSKIGCPYVWGATGPDEFDCSGLVQWACKQNGISMGRTTYDQVFYGEEVVGSPQRGDLVFPDAGHVGIALGGDQMVHAPQPGENVKIGNYWTAPYAIRRIGTNSGSVGSTTVAPGFQAKSAGDTNLSDVVPGYGALQQQIDNLNSAVAEQVGIFKGFTTMLESVATFFNLLMSQQGWYRIGMVAIGTVVVFGGAGFLMADFSGRILNG
ncbi:putative CHAP-domain endopeptidase [Rhodococcus phage Toil]|uniref:Putative CHAP-domain endopeptidase n=1 Tax=Rhodococcus phage Toil TaxID=1975614 RepID=A0A1W6DXV0_9VIRU|nr:virion structural protein [Rhodococcus phage Toil]ARK07709.1 putative CHAP-domain endopeptidase [Rhodococcus phage Toil]